MTPDDVMARVATLLPSATPAPAELRRGQAVVVVPRDGVLETLRGLRHAPALAFDFLADWRAVACLAAPRGGVVETLRGLRHGPALAFDVLADLTAVDYLGRTPRFEVVYELNS